MNKLKILSFLLIVLLASINISAQKKVSVDLPMKSRGLMPAVEVMVNGKGPFLFAIDTGAGGLARVDSSLMKQLGLKTVGQAQAGDGSGQNTRTLDVVRLDSLKVGDIEFKDVEGITRDYNTSPNLPKIDGILGFNLFAEYLLTLDFPAKRVRIESGELPKANAENIVNFENPNGIAVVEISVGSQKVKADIDSGNLVSGFILPTAIVEKSSLASQPVVVGRARTVSNDVEIKQVRLKDSIRLASFEFKEPTVSYPALSVANFGAASMQNFALTFDQKNKRVRLEKAKAAAETKETKPLAQIENVKDYVGIYGERTISDEAGSLFVQRPGGMKLKLISLSKDEFTLEQVPTARIKFARDASGKISDIEILTPAGTWEKIKKN